MKPQPPTDQEAKELCKLGQGAQCCRYLAASGKGWSCEKLGDLKNLLDSRVAAGKMTAKGNNCPGKGQA